MFCEAAQEYLQVVAETGRAMLEGHVETDNRLPELLGRLTGADKDPWLFAPVTASYANLVAERKKLNENAEDKPEMEERLRRVVLALRAQRSALAPWDTDFILVQAPQGFLEYYSGGRFVKEYRVALGSAKPVHDPETGEMLALNRTLPVDSHIQTVVLNPEWVVPHRIAVDEIAPRALKDPRYLKKHGFTTYSYPGGGKTVYTQEPGPENALGRVKFEFPNDMGYYLHGSPRSHRYLLDKDYRLLSHGCVRVKHALKLATRILAADQGLNWDSIQRLLKGRETREIPLKKPLAVHVIYSTIAADSLGNLYDSKDSYKLE